MTLPQTRQRWEEMTKLLSGIAPIFTEAQILESNANWLIERLYKPDTRLARITNRVAVEEVGIDWNEPINWGDLAAYIEQDGDRWIIILEEATEGQCPTLCAYIGKWLIAWGWENVEVVTEW